MVVFFMKDSSFIENTSVRIHALIGVQIIIARNITELQKSK